MQQHPVSEWFGKPGYLPLSQYVADISYMQENGPWKLPIGAMDRLQMGILALITRFSWIADALSVFCPSRWSPAYSILTAYLYKQGVLDSLNEKEIRVGAGFSYMAMKEVIDGDRSWKIVGQGFSRDPAIAFSKAIGELLERVISGYGDMTKRRRLASPDDLLRKKESVFYPPMHHRFLDAQKKRYTKLRYSSADPIEWVLGKDILSRKSIWIPSQITSWFFALRYPKEKLFIHPTSNGAAGYFTRTGATLRGLLEVVHRDGLLTHWLTMIPPRRIDETALPETLQEMVRALESIGLSIFLLDTTSLSLPSVGVVAISDQAIIPQVVLSGAAALTFEQALSNALEEMLLISGAFVVYANHRHVESPEPFVSKLDKETRQLYWRGEERVRQFRWFVEGELISYDEVCRGDIVCRTGDAHALRACLNQLKSLGEGYGPIVYFPENPLQRKLGFFVAQVFIPRAFPLYLLEYYGTFESDRLVDFAHTKEVDSWTLNPLPHMFS